MRVKTYFNWSSGKDAALALHYLQQDKNYEVAHLLTAVNAFHNRVSMHGVRRELLQQQVAAVAISSSTIELPEEPSMDAYEQLLHREVVRLRNEGFQCAAFGDIFLQDLRTYREAQLARLNVHAVFPLWKRNTRDLLLEFIDLGFKAIVVCINGALLDRSFAGRIIDNNFIHDLPPGVDACGENGEFHTFCFDGPVFSHPISFVTGEKIYREYKAPVTDADNTHAFAQSSNIGFWFCDLLPAALNSTANSSDAL